MQRHLPECECGACPPGARILDWNAARRRRGLPEVLPRPKVIAPSPTPHDLDALAARLAAVEGTQQAQGRELAVIRGERNPLPESWGGAG